MVTYNPNIPIPGNDVLVDVPQIQDNFESANTIINKDHFAFNDGTAAKQGLHRKLSFPTAIPAPDLEANEGIIFPSGDANDASTRTQLFYKNTTSTQQITNRFYDPSLGYVMLPFGTSGNPALIVMWGVVSTAGSHSAVVTFPTIANYTGGPAGFPHNVFNVQLTTSLGSGDQAAKSAAIRSGTLANTGFTIQMSSNAIGSVYWVAIGN